MQLTEFCDKRGLDPCVEWNKPMGQWVAYAQEDLSGQPLAMNFIPRGQSDPKRLDSYRVAADSAEAALDQLAAVIGGGTVIVTLQINDQMLKALEALNQGGKLEPKLEDLRRNKGHTMTVKFEVPEDLRYGIGPHNQRSDGTANSSAT